MANVLETSTSPEGDTLLVVQSKRGQEFVVSSEKLAMAWVDLVSDMANEDRFGWVLNTQWFKEEIARVNKQAMVKVRK